MFVCEECAEKAGVNIFQFSNGNVSYGPCEVCKYPSVCLEVGSSQISAIKNGKTKKCGNAKVVNTG